VKPANVIVQPDGVAQAAGFWNRPPGKQEARPDPHWEVIGPIHYMAPERLRDPRLSRPLRYLSAGRDHALPVADRKLPFSGEDFSVSTEIVKKASALGNPTCRISSALALDAISIARLAKTG